MKVVLYFVFWALVYLASLVSMLANGDKMYAWIAVLAVVFGWGPIVLTSIFLTLSAYAQLHTTPPVDNMKGGGR